jgi:hypothetical protein
VAPLERITLSALADVSSLDATVTISADGSLGGQAMAGDLTAVLSSNDQAQSRIDITGDLLGPVATKVGGSVVGLFRPSKVSVLTTDSTYIVVSGLTDICVKPSDPSSTAALPAQPAGPDHAHGHEPIGRYVGDGLNGQAVGTTSSTARRSSRPPRRARSTVQKFARPSRTRRTRTCTSPRTPATRWYTGAADGTSGSRGRLQRRSTSRASIRTVIGCPAPATCRLLLRRRW